MLGASGLVGSALMGALAEAKIPAVGAARRIRGPATVALDATDEQAVAAQLLAQRPEVVVIASAFAHVDGCERDPERSERENVGVPRTVAAHAGAARVVFFSTDHVFDGSQPRSDEDAPVHPLSVYARHKRQAEELLLRRGRSLVVRTSWVYGEELDRKNFLYQVLDASRAGRTLRLPEGQAGCPTPAQWLARSTVQLVQGGMTGVVHLSGAEPLTKARWAELAAEGLGIAPARIEEVSWAEAGQLAPRPRQVVLASRRHPLTCPGPLAILPGLRPRIA